VAVRSTPKPSPGLGATLVAVGLCALIHMLTDELRVERQRTGYDRRRKIGYAECLFYANVQINITNGAVAAKRTACSS
jgi:hypothetical protein